MTGTRATRRIWIAFFAIYALVAQSLAGAHASGVRATSWPLEFVGLTLCLDHGTGTLPPGDSPLDQGYGPDCCLPGCAMFAPAIASPPAAMAAFPPRHGASSAAIPRPAAVGFEAGPRKGRPANPRAPPLAAV